MDELSFKELFWLLENHYDEERRHYELLANVVSVGYARTQSKKKIKLFDDKPNKKPTQKITQAEKDNTVNYLLNKFNI